MEHQLLSASSALELSVQAGLQLATTEDELQAPPRQLRRGADEVQGALDPGAVAEVQDREGPLSLRQRAPRELTRGGELLTHLLIEAAPRELLTQSVRDDVDAAMFRTGTVYSVVLGPAAYTVGIALGFVHEAFAFACYAAVALYWVFPHATRARPKTDA